MLVDPFTLFDIEHLYNLQIFTLPKVSIERQSNKLCKLQKSIDFLKNKCYNYNVINEKGIVKKINKKIKKTIDFN